MRKNSYTLNLHNASHVYIIRFWEQLVFLVPFLGGNMHHNYLGFSNSERYSLEESISLSDSNMITVYTIIL